MPTLEIASTVPCTFSPLALYNSNVSPTFTSSGIVASVCSSVTSTLPLPLPRFKFVSLVILLIASLTVVSDEVSLSALLSLDTLL